MQNTDIVRPETLSLPKGGGAITGLKGDVAGAGPDGANALSIPLSVNPGRGYAPSLALSYHSRSGNGSFGMGWSVDSPAVRRRSKKGVPDYNEKDEFVGPNGEVIVPFLADDGTANVRTSNTLLDIDLGEGFTVHRYHYRIESDFSRLEYWVSTETTGRDFWLQYTPDGQVLLYGNTQQARVSDPQTLENTAIWLMESSVSVTGEQIYWMYRAEDDTGCEAKETAAHPNASAQRYLAAVCYGNRVAGRVLPGVITTPALTDWLFVVLFDYGERTADAASAPQWVAPGSGDWACRQDCFSSWEYGFEVRTRRLCRQILSYHFTGTLSGSTSESVPQLVTRLTMRYTESPMVTTLVGVSQSGLASDGTFTSLPETVFGWSTFKADTGHYEWPVKWQEREDLANMNSLQPYQMVDLNGEGLAGILYQDSSAWWYRPPIRQTDGDADAVTWDEPTPLPIIPALRDSGVLADLNGDGYMEWVVSSAGVNGYYSRTPERGWLNFTPISAYPVEYLHPRAQLADVSGSGLADLVLIGPKSVRLYAGTGDGWEKAINVLQPTGVKLPVPGVDERVLVAFSDMAGSGQQHLVEIKFNGVRYWPNLGHGQFGAPVTMTGWFFPQPFIPSNIFLADVDGSGTSDIIIAVKDYLIISINQSGNSFAAPFQFKLPEGVHYDNTCELHVADIRGLGIASLILTVPHPKPRHYVCDLTSVKPWLLNQMNNYMGARHNFTYRSSAQFWLDEKQDALTAGESIPASYLPFPLHLLSRTDVTDNITGNHLVSTARYRGGAWDGREREFRGFGYVEIQDTDTLTSQGTTTEISQPSLTRNWFATGLPAVDDRLAQSWWSGDSGAFEHFSARFTSGYGDNEKPYIADESDDFWLRRGMKGLLVRSELYGMDGSDQQPIPYQVSESRPQVRQVAAKGEGSYPVVWPTIAETRTYIYERVSNDPQCSQQITLSSDQNGLPLYSATVNYPRRTQPATSPYPYTLPDTLFASSYDDQQQQLVVTCLKNYWYSMDDMAVGLWVSGLLDQMQSYVYMYSSAPEPGLTLEDLSHSGAPLGTPANQALAGWQQLWYQDSNNTATPGDPAFPPRVGLTETAVLDAEMVTALKEDFTDTILQQAGYIWISGIGCWVTHRNFTTYGTAEHFWLPQTVRDSELTGAITLTHDAYDCVVTKVVDAAGLTTQAEYDWRFLTPVKITDVNNNIQQVTLDGLGRVTSLRFSGTENGVAAGYSDADFVPPTTVDQALALTPPLPVAQCLVYENLSWGIYSKRPAHVLTLTTDRYDQGEGSDEQQIRQTVQFSDGFGRLLQTSVRFEAGDAWQRTDDGTLVMETAHTDTRWAVSGRTEYDNKGQAIRTYQPYFLNSWEWVVDDSAREDLYADTHYFDPLGREREVLTAKGYQRRTLYTPWFVVSEDENDLFGVKPDWWIEITVVANNTVVGETAGDSIKVTAYDPYGDPLVGKVVTLSSDSDVNIEPLTQSTGVDGSVTAVLTSTVAGQHTVDATCDGHRASAIVTFTADVNHLSPTLSTLAANPPSIDDTGTGASTLTLILKDIYGNRISGQYIDLISSRADLVHSGFTDRKDGSYDATIYSLSLGDITLTVKVNGNVLEGLSTIFHIVPVAEEMPTDTGLSVNGYEFSRDSNFPVTGILSATFQFLFNGDASNNSAYQWSIDQPWVSIDSEANVTFIDTPDSTNNTVTITAIPIDTGTPRYVYTFTVSQWFVTAGGAQKNWADADAWCKANGLEMPSLADVVYYDPEFHGPQRYWGPYLWSEWGDCSRYADAGVTPGYFCWVTDVGDNGVHRNISLEKGGEYVDDTGLTDATELYVVGKRTL